jgi:hypothetical protein
MNFLDIRHGTGLSAAVRNSVRATTSLLERCIAPCFSDAFSGILRLIVLATPGSPAS